MYKFVQIVDDGRDIREIHEEEWRGENYHTLQYYWHPEAGACIFGWNNDNGQVMFATIDSRGRVDKMRSERWRSKMLNICPYYQKHHGEIWPHFLVQRENIGDGQPEFVMCRLTRRGDVWEDINVGGDGQGDRTLGDSYTHCISWFAKNKAMFLAHNVHSGATAVFKIKRDSIKVLSEEYPGRSEFDVISPFYIGKQPYMMCHKTEERYYCWAKVDKRGIHAVYEDNWRFGNDNMCTFQLGGGGSDNSSDTDDSY